MQQKCDSLKLKGYTRRDCIKNEDIRNEVFELNQKKI